MIFWNYVDLENSSVKIINPINLNNFEILSIQSIKNLKKIDTNLEIGFQMIINEIILKDELPYDIFKINEGLFYPRIISESLKKAFEEMKISGYEIRLFDKIKTHGFE